MENLYRQDEENQFILLGDSGYALRPWLMTPLEDPPIPDTPADRFHRAVMTARCSIERCNGVLKNRWRCLLKHRTLHYTPTVAANIINTCVVLHNMCLHYNIPEPENDEELLVADFGMYMPLGQLQENEGGYAGRVNPDLHAARILQRRIIQTHFQ
ncbi:putative nuclease HARBI1 [Anthonomus grandis grandis]|uniref:putative nuclease HARBI1 n=1 Tax=Anthonomus grandis grandis TaxID=2921223 RepID=UPI002165C245|nr:putative nuclease HARBI1 [Anthonomus grandis grandis]